MLARMWKKESLNIVDGKVSMVAPQKTKNWTTKWYSNFTSGYISKENENGISKRYLHFLAYYSIIHNNQDM